VERGSGEGKKKKVARYSARLEMRLLRPAEEQVLVKTRGSSVIAGRGENSEHRGKQHRQSYLKTDRYPFSLIRIETRGGGRPPPNK